MARSRQESSRRRFKLISAAAVGLMLAACYASDRVMFRYPEKQVGHYTRKLSRILQKHRVVAYWDFDDRIVRERVGRAAHDHEGAERTRGRFGTGRHFTRSEGGRMLTGVSHSTAGKNYSISGWLKLLPPVTSQAIFHDLIIADGQFTYWVPGQNESLTWTVSSTNAFFHFVLTVNSETEDARMYINGEQVSQIELEEDVRHRARMIEFGQSQWKSPPDYVLDDFVIWDDPLSPCDVRNLAHAKRSVLRRLAGATRWKLRVSRALAAGLHRISATFDLFNPFLHESRLYRDVGIAIDLRMSKGDIKALNRYHNRRLDNGQTSRDTSARRSIRVAINDTTYEATVEVLGTRFDAETPEARRTYIIDIENDENQNPDWHRRILLEPFDHRAVMTALTAGALAGRCTQSLFYPAAWGPRLRPLSINGKIQGVYLVRENTMNAPFAWPHTENHWLTLIRNLPVSADDVLATFDEISDRYLSLLQSDPRSPLSSRAIRYAVRSRERRHLSEALRIGEGESYGSPLARVLRFVDEGKLLGNNPCPEMIYHDLDLSLRECNGVILSYKSLSPAIIDDIGELAAMGDPEMRPATPTRITIRVTASTDGRSISTNRHFTIMPPENPLPVLRVRTSGEFSSTQRNACLVELTDGKRWATSPVLPGRIRYRGNSSLHKANKKYFSIKMDTPHELFGMTNTPYLLLTSWYRDKTFMRDRLAYDLFRSLGGEATPRLSPHAHYLELVINGKYHGIYGVSERVDGRMLGYDPENRHLATPAVLYKAMDRKASFRSLHVEAMVQREPHWRFGEHWKPYANLIDFVSSSDDDVFAARIPRIVDIENCIDFQILVNFTCNTEGVRYNYYLARSNEPGSRFYFIPWDYDMGFYHDRWLRNYLFDRLMAALPGYRQRLLNRWQELRADILSEGQLMARIDALQAELSNGSVERNFERWPPRRAQTHAEAVADLRAWIQNRLRYLDRKITEIAEDKS